MRDSHGQAQVYLNGAAMLIRRGRHEQADVLLRAAWRVFGDGLSLENASQDDLRRLGIMARVSGVGPTPDSALERLRDALAR